MRSLGDSIRRTKSYSNFFIFPIDSSDIYLWLISVDRVPLSKIISLEKKQLTKKEEKFRLSRYEISNKKINESKKIINLLSRVPTIKLISITGSVAINNSKEEDDVDFMIVTSDHSLWLTRAVVTIIVSMFGRRRRPNSSYESAANTICLNLWLEERSLKIPSNKRNLYTAHEVLQTLPVFDRSNYHNQFISHNSWTKRYLANAYFEKTNQLANQNDQIDTGNHSHNLILKCINYVFYLIQLLYMKPKITSETISIKSAYFHKINFSKIINKHLENN
jgi:predicted nucleotidyltransferase